MRPLYKTTIVIWSDSDVTSCEIASLAHEAETGDAYCSHRETVLVPEPEKDPAWDGTEFFSCEDDAGNWEPPSLGEVDLSEDLEG